jgi:hypothetical protein
MYVCRPRSSVLLPRAWWLELQKSESSRLRHC